MARVAVDAVVHISINVRMVKIGRIVSAMTTRTGEHGVVRRICVACRANRVGIAMVWREECVIRKGKICRQPRGGCMARCTRSGPSRCNVVGIRRTCESGLVAGVAIRWGAHKHIVDVA